MCGRFSLFAPQWVVEDRFEATVAYPYERRYNAAPSQSLPVITDHCPNQIRASQWGLIPPWADDASTTHINARAETLADRPSFSDALEGLADRRDTSRHVAGRCLVLADGFYEWDEHGRPFRVARTDGSPFAMAGLWTRWRPATTQTELGAFGADEADTGPDRRETFAIVTTDANTLVEPIHDRMPVILSADAERRWLTDATSAAIALLEPAPATTLEAAPVSSAVNDPANDSPAVLAVADST